MKFKLGCHLNYEIHADSTFVFNICALETQKQKTIAEDLNINPSCQQEEYINGDLDNSYFRLIVPEGKLVIDYQATVELVTAEFSTDDIKEIPVTDLPLEIIPYLYPSRYCQSDRLMKLAEDEFGECESGYSRVEAICDWIYRKIDYISGSSDSQTSASDTLIERAGVCRDFAHLGIAFCRALDIPARFVSAYAWELEPPDFHACFEAYLGDRWYIFDPTRLANTKGLVKIGTGRDAADVAFATIFGSISLNQMNVYIDRVND